MDDIFRIERRGDKASLLSLAGLSIGFQARMVIFALFFGLLAVAPILCNGFEPNFVIVDY